MKTNEPIAWIYADNKTIISNVDYNLFQPASSSNKTDWSPAYLTGDVNYTPIAWSCWSEGMQAAIITTTEPDMYGWQSIIPLFSHPAKTLTDEEIYQLAEYHGINDWLYETSVADFARAILRKAQEK